MFLFNEAFGVYGSDSNSVLSDGLRSTESVFENEQGIQTDISNVIFYWKHSLRGAGRSHCCPTGLGHGSLTESISEMHKKKIKVNITAHR